MDSEFKLIDVSHTVEHGMVTYQGLPAPSITDHLSRSDSRKLYAPGTEFHIGKIEMVANTGTYIDSPFHRYADGADLSDLPLSSLANLEGFVIRHSVGREISTATLTGLDLEGKAVLFQTGWDQHWRTARYFDGTHPYLNAESAEYLAEAGARLVGIDSYNIDYTGDGNRPAHSILLRRGIPIVEHLCRLEDLPDQGFKFFAVPVKVKEFGTFPVRAFGIVSQ